MLSDILALELHAKDHDQTHRYVLGQLKIEFSASPGQTLFFGVYLLREETLQNPQRANQQRRWLRRALVQIFKFYCLL